MNPKQCLQILRDAGVDLELVEARELGAGQNSFAFLVDGQWVFRFPMHQSALESLRTEADLLRRIGAILTTTVPMPAWQSLDAEVGRAYVGHRAIPGTAISVEQIRRLTPDLQRGLGRDIGLFLKELHSTPASLLDGSQVTLWETPEQWRKFSDDLNAWLRSRIARQAWNRLREDMDEVLSELSGLSFQPALQHGDFGLGNMLVDVSTARLTGVIDFGSSGIGDPAVDIAGLLSISGPGEALLPWIEQHYGDLSTLLDRAEVYRRTFAVQEALLGAMSDDEAAIMRGTSKYA